MKLMLSLIFHSQKKKASLTASRASASMSSDNAAFVTLFPFLSFHFYFSSAVGRDLTDSDYGYCRRSTVHL